MTQYGTFGTPELSGLRLNPFGQVTDGHEFRATVAPSRLIAVVGASLIPVPIPVTGWIVGAS